MLRDAESRLIRISFRERMFPMNKLRFTALTVVSLVLLSGFLSLGLTRTASAQPKEVNFDLEPLEMDQAIWKAPGAASVGFKLLVVFLVSLALLILIVMGLWKVFTKAGKPGWAAIIPIYNVIVILEICGRPVWWVLLILFIPCVNIFLMLIVMFDLAKSFGKDAGFGLGLWVAGLHFSAHPGVRQRPVSWSSSNRRVTLGLAATGA
jgi:hypothetical protein